MTVSAVVAARVFLGTRTRYVVRMGEQPGQAGGVYTTDGEPMNAYWPAADTMLFAKGLTAEQMKAAVSGGSVKDNAELMALIGKVDSATGADVHVVAGYYGEAYAACEERAFETGAAFLHRTVGIRFFPQLAEIRARFYTAGR